jgi:hypothetical protein
METEFLHAGTLAIQRQQCHQRLVTIQEAAEKEEKIAINASPNDPPSGFEPMGSDVMAFAKYQDDTLAVLEDKLTTADQPERMALALYLFDRWTTLKDKAAFTSSGQEGHIHIKFHEPAFSNDMRRGNEKQTASVLRTKSGGSRNAVGIEVEGDMGSDETPVDNRSSARSPAKNLRRHTMAGILRSSPERVDVLDGGSSSEEEVLRRDDRPEKTKKKMKIGVKWRRGNSSAWRDFYDEKLVDFSVKDAKLNITRASFRRDDTWTEFKPNSASSAKISDRTLTYLRYPFDDFQRDTGMRTYDSYDSEGNGIGPARIVYERILKVHLPLVFVGLPFICASQDG